MPSSAVAGALVPHLPFRIPLAARGSSLWRRVTAKQGRILGVGDETMLFHWEESTTTKTAAGRRNDHFLNQGGAWGFGPQALSFVGYDAKTSCPPHFAPGDPKTLARDATDCCHGLLAASTSSCRVLLESF